MIRDLTLPAASDPVAVALTDPDCYERLLAAASAFLGRRQDGLTSIQRRLEADDIVQDAITRALKNRDRFDPSKDVVRWLIGFIFNVVREKAKKHVREKIERFGNEVYLNDLAVDASRSVEEAFADKAHVLHWLDQLPAIDRKILCMKFDDDLSCSEIGEHIGLNETAARVRVFRAMAKLKKIMGVSGEGQS